MKKEAEHVVNSSLNVRLFNAALIFALILIAAFTAIQVRSQMETATHQNIYFSKLAVIIIQKSLKQAANDTLAKGRSVEDFKKELAVTAEGLVKAKITRDILIADREGLVVAESSGSGLPLRPGPEDLERIENIIDFGTSPDETYSFLNRPQNALDIFIPVAIGGKTSLVLKTSYELGGIQEALRTVYIPVLITVAVVIVFSTLNALGLSRKIVSPVKILNEASKRIAKGELSIHLDIQTNDEIEELTHTFNNMTKQLIRMKEIAENANPLTKLPGNTMIREQIERRISEGKKFAVIHADLDNFKVYNDCYGIGAGDVAIKMTGDLFREALKKYGGPEEFLGHEGGDDFVLLASLAHVKPITDFFLAEFDRRSRDLYSREDQERGYILGRERRLREKGEEERPEAIVLFPLMTISLAGLSNEECPFTSYAEITNRISDVKHRAKRTKGNCFILVK